MKTIDDKTRGVALRVLKNAKETAAILAAQDCQPALKAHRLSELESLSNAIASLEAPQEISERVQDRIIARANALGYGPSAAIRYVFDQIGISITQDELTMSGSPYGFDVSGRFSVFFKHEDLEGPRK
jgi:hypothetical protein